MTSLVLGPRHPRCGGEWRGPFDTDTGPVQVCNTCGAERPSRRPTHYLSRRQVAQRIGVTPGALSRYKLPAPDVVVGDVRGWLPGTIDTWHAHRPGRGARTDLHAPAD